jgi:DNA polymerase
MKMLAIDLETYSEADIKKTGLYKYAENAEIMLFAYAFGDEPVQVVDFTAGEKLPQRVLDALTDKNVLKTAYNAAFERKVIENFMNIQMDAAEWLCTMVQGLTLGLPSGLEKLGKLLKISEDKAKMAVGKQLIQYFCKPCKMTKANKMRTRNLPCHAADKWELFKKYCANDVEAERAIRKKLLRFFPDERERRLWSLDQKINDAGIRIDFDVARNAVELDGIFKRNVTAEAVEISGVENPQSREQVLDWIESIEGFRPKVLDKAARAELVGEVKSPKVQRMLEIKNLLAKTSVKKYEAMLNAVCRDGRVRGMLQFYGASRTGRWAGRLVQLHNLPQNKLDDLDFARATLKAGDFELMEMFYDNIPDTLSQLIRTAFIADSGKRFIVADFSAIEARVVAWLADEKWRLRVFDEGGDIYCASASQMFKVPVVKHGVNGHLRAKGKVAELACGYGGGVNALLAMGALNGGLTEKELPAIIEKWRNSSPHIVKMWRDVEKCAKQAIRSRLEIRYKHGINFLYKSGFLFIQLPSGRRIAYAKPRIETESDFGKESITYEGAVQTKGSGGWGKNYTWGGKLVENIVQASARDCLAEAMLKLDQAGYKIVMHVHDEVILEMPEGKGNLAEACAIMDEKISWADGLSLKAEGYETKYYKKD